MRLGVLAVALHPDRERLRAAQREEAVERRRDGADRVLQEARALAAARVARDREAADDVGVAADVLRRGVHDDVGAELERLLQVRATRTCCRRPRSAADGVRALGDRARCRRTFSSGFVGVSIHTTPGRASSAFSTRPTVGQVGVGEAVALRREHLREQPVGAAVDVVHRHRPLARARRARARAEMAAMPGREGDAVLAPLERREALLERGPRRVDGARVVVAAARLADAVLRRTSRSGRSAR